uniref:Costars family protein ABRACL n=5 Tax=Neoaves TaxID=3078114 RepID=A0A663EP21_AQUCH
VAAAGSGSRPSLRVGGRGALPGQPPVAAGGYGCPSPGRGPFPGAPCAGGGGSPGRAVPCRAVPCRAVPCRAVGARGAAGRGVSSVGRGRRAASKRGPAEEPSSQITMNVEHEISLLVEEIRRLGTKNADGQVSVKFGVLFADEKCANLFEALVGTLKAAKRRKIVAYQGELLLQGVHDNVDIMLLQD